MNGPETLYQTLRTSFPWPRFKLYWATFDGILFHVPGVAKLILDQYSRN